MEKQKVLIPLVEKKKEEPSTGNIGVVGNNHCLIATVKGLYTVSLAISLPYLSKEQKGCSLSFPTYSLQNFLRFEVVDQYARVECKPSLETRVIRNRKPRSEPPTKESKGPSLLKLDNDNDDEEEQCSTLIETIFPPSHHLEIYWTIIEKKKKKKEIKEVKKSQQEERQLEQRPLNVTVEQYTLHSIGGGVISSAAEFRYTIQNGSVNTLYIMLPNEELERKVRILRVEGANVKKWEFKKLRLSALSSDKASDTASETSFANVIQGRTAPRVTPVPQQIPAADEEQKAKLFIKVILECGVDTNYTLKVFAEMEMPDQGAQIFVPNFNCTSVNREKGNLAIEATGNIEISELLQRQLTKVDVRELPPALSNRASNPILLGYKFLETQNTVLQLDIKKHDDVAVLVAIIEEALFRTTYSEGFLLTQVLLKVRNTSQDFVKVKLPMDTMLWSSSSESKPVRPAKDKQGQILIPLKRSSSECVFTVELYYLSKSVLLKNSGRISMEFPTFNTPITYTYFQVYLPNNFTYGEFEGDLRECKNKYWSSEPTVLNLASTEASSSNSRNANHPRKYQQQQNQMQVQQQMIMPQMQMQMLSNSMPQPQFHVASNAMNDDDDIFAPPAPPSLSSNESLSSSVLGVMPVTLTPLLIGEPFYFERGVLLDSNEERHSKISVEFKQIKKSWWDKRSLFPWRKFTYSVLFGFFLCLFFYLFNVASYFPGSK